MEVMLAVISGVSVWSEFKRRGGFQEVHGGRETASLNRACIGVSRLPL